MQSIAAKASKLTNLEQKQIKQATSLQKIGKFDEAEKIYKNILSKSPSIREAFIPLKNIYINSNRINDEIIEYAELYISSNNNDVLKKVDVIDIYILANNDKWKVFLNDIIDGKVNNKKKIIKPLLYILLSQNKEQESIEIINKLRIKLNDNSYYALEMGMHYSLIGNIEKSIDEYLLYLQYNKNSISIISERIMLLSDYNSYIDKIKLKLNSSKLYESKLILAYLEFKLKNYSQSYELLKSLNDEDKLIEFINDLIKINQIDFAKIVIEDVLTKSTNKIILDKAIFQLAQLFESTINSKEVNMPLSNEIYNNDLLASPFIKLEESQSGLLNKAINIYDSLRLNSKKDHKSTYRLAEIKYRIQGDLDNAKKLYEYIYKTSKKINFKKLSLIRIIDINFSKGDLENVKLLIENYKSSIKNKELLTLLEIKDIQLTFYMGKKDELISLCNTLLKKINKDNKYYNDILDILSIAYIAKDDNELNEVSNTKLKLFQNKRVQVIDLITNSNYKNEKIHNMLQYQLAYLHYLQKNYNQAISTIDNINETSLYKEYGNILISELYDYILNQNNMAIIKYNDFIDAYSSSIFYESIRIRLRELIKIEKGL